MKLKISSLLLSLCLAILPSTLRADSKTVTEADAAAPISINKGDTITFSLPGSGWQDVSLNMTSDALKTMLAWDSTSFSKDGFTTISFDALTAGQVVLFFSTLGTDPVYQFNGAASFIINIQ